jgi:hypothetical protein
VLTKPTADQFLKALNGKIYRPAARSSVISPSMGWNGSGDQVTSINLQFLLGKARESVIVETSVAPERHDAHLALHHLVFEVAHMRRPRFPMMLERSTVRIAVDGRVRSFTTYNAGPAAVAIAALGDVSVMVRCSVKRLPKLSLEQLKPEELRDALRK